MNPSMVTMPIQCEISCSCSIHTHSTKFVVVCGGPGAGKTAILEAARKDFCEHVAVLPEAAGVIFSGGFWRLKTDNAIAAAQRAIFHVQREMENLVIGEKRWAVGLCDRGTLDGLAYWPRSEEEYFATLDTSIEREYSRYAAVIHLRSPEAHMGYNHQNSLRIESPEEAAIIDQRIAEVWRNHSNYHEVSSHIDFLEKARQALRLIEEEIPACCRQSDVK